jgi:hypothetical protein
MLTLQLMICSVIEYYRTNGSQVYLASLDAQKAFDKLWRIGLFDELNGKILDILWRILFEIETRVCFIIFRIYFNFPFYN